MLNTSDLVLIGGGLIPGGVSNLTVQAGTGGTQFTVGDMTGGPTNVDLSAGGTGNSIVGPDAYTAWTFQQVNGQVPDSFTQASGSVASTVYFSGIGAITGGSGGNEFVFIQTGFAGSIDGGAGDNTLDFTAYGAAVTVTVTAAGTLHGVQGTATPITNNGTFNNIDNIIGARLDPGRLELFGRFRHQPDGGRLPLHAHARTRQFQWHLQGDRLDADRRLRDRWQSPPFGADRGRQRGHARSGRRLRWRILLQRRGRHVYRARAVRAS